MTKYEQTILDKLDTIIGLLKKEKPEGQSLQQLIDSCRFTYVNSDINDRNFPDIGKVRGKMELVDIKERKSTEEVEKLMENKGLVPANLAELLEYAKESRNGKDWVVALGSSWVHPGGRRLVPYLCGYAGERDLYLYWGGPGDRWDAGCRFLASRK